MRQWELLFELLFPIVTHCSNSLFQGVVQLAIALSEETEDHILAATAWALGQIGRHTPEHSKAVALANVLPRLLHLYLKTGSSEDLQAKVSSDYLVINILYVQVTLLNQHFSKSTSQAKRSLKNILQKCTHLPALEPLLHDAPPNILKHVVGQFAKVLPHDSKARRVFVTTGGLKKVQEIKADTASALHEHITTINSCYPEEIVR